MREFWRTPVIFLTAAGLLVGCAGDSQASEQQGSCGRRLMAIEDALQAHGEYIRATLEAISHGEVDNIDSPEELERASQSLALFFAYPMPDGRYDAFSGNATVFMNRDGRLMLVTAYHVLTGEGKYDPNSTDFVVGLAKTMTSLESQPKVVLDGRFVKFSGDVESDVAVVGFNYSETVADFFDWKEATVGWLGSMPDRVFAVVRQSAYENANGGKEVVLRGRVLCRSNEGKLIVNISTEDGMSGTGFGPEESGVVTHVLSGTDVYEDGDEFTLLVPISLARKHLDAVSEALPGSEIFSR